MVRTTPALTGFSSVKLPAALVQQARQAAQPLRRSVAGQIEYWAALGRVVEHAGLTAQESQTAIETYEAAAHNALLNDSLDQVDARFAMAEQHGNLADRVREVVLGNRANVPARAKAA